jgi:hypothetical protein
MIERMPWDNIFTGIIDKESMLRSADVYGRNVVSYQRYLLLRKRNPYFTMNSLRNWMRGDMNSRLAYILAVIFLEDLKW